ncbi:Nif3-like dinuclear metal center hexameric protein [Deinococcus sp. KNUC1210]|uniref:Nif3-like dinuclear metal center hexameric protein n=1 Tax=Deinococcus sp. KNUC1210 TaxID=2917691 RepID=UPI001EEFA089|nr:Nif3-like dinuclear metal center hexameric protein [Deinococcus sp. KNUC1210]ULH16487.1 Nif3-like dinuclear metal center hexameric protein [Deinococcus sp. KNUC1210]
MTEIMTSRVGGVALDDVTAWLDRYLKISEFKDWSNNGLQVEGNRTVTRIAASVDTSLRSIEEAIASGADLMVVHHGLFWNKPLMVTGPHRRRIQTALDAGLNIYAAHLPLDAHPEIGNNAMIASALSLQDASPFAGIGQMGELPYEQTLQEFAERVQKLTGEICLVHGGGGGTGVRRLGIVSGSGAEFISQAAALGLDTLLTGEPEHKHFHDAFELGLNVVYAGHYETEVFGVRALAAKLEDQFGLPWQFLHLPTGL